MGNDFDLEAAVRKNTIVSEDDPQETQYRRDESLLEADRRQLAVHKEKFENIRRELDHLRGSVDKLSMGHDELKAFKNKVLGMGIILGIILTVVVGYFIREHFQTK